MDQNQVALWTNFVKKHNVELTEIGPDLIVENKLDVSKIEVVRKLSITSF